MADLTPTALHLQRLLDTHGIEGIAREFERAQAEHDRDMMALTRQVDRLMFDRARWYDLQCQSEKTIAELDARLARAVERLQSPRFTGDKDFP